MGSNDSKLTPKDLSEARNAADGFLQAVTQGDDAAARKLLIVQEGETVDFKNMRESIGSFQLGEAVAEEAQAVVVAIVQPKPGQDAPPPLPLVLQKTGTMWKVDMAQSITRLLGVNPEEMLKKAMEGMGEALAQGMDAMAQGMSAALNGGDATANPDGPARKSKTSSTRKPHKASRKC